MRYGTTIGFGSRLSIAVTIVGLAALAPTARGDIVKLADGRTFEGSIVAETDSKVTIQTMVEGTKVVLGFSKIDATIEKKELPADFFDPRPAPRISSPKDFRPGQALYLEVSLVGRPGKDYYAMGIHRALAYANSNGIPHVVFRIDSVGKNPDEANALFNIVKNGKKDLKLHALVARCTGAALAAGFWCDTVYLLPGGFIGGKPEAGETADSAGEAEEQAVVWSAVADRVNRETGRKGAAADLIRAILDPEIELVGWKGEDGKLQVAPEAPADLPKEKLVFSVARGETLQITYDQAAAFGRGFTGEVADLGKVLNLKGWALESDYGKKAMAAVAAEKAAAAAKTAKKEKAAQAAFEKKVGRNVSRREVVVNYAKNCVAQAREWDPKKGQYKTFADYWNWGWGWGGDVAGPDKWTAESQKRWKDRTDACMSYLKEAAKALSTLKRLDDEAVKLGIEPTLEPGKAEEFLEQLNARYKQLAAERGRTESFPDEKAGTK